MTKKDTIFLGAIAVLSIALITVTLMYVNTRKNLEVVLENIQALYEANTQIEELEEELEIYKNMIREGVLKE